MQHGGRIGPLRSGKYPVIKQEQHGASLRMDVESQARGSRLFARMTLRLYPMERAVRVCASQMWRVGIEPEEKP